MSEEILMKVTGLKVVLPEKEGGETVIVDGVN